MARVWFHRLSALLWVVLGILAFPLGWAETVVAVWLASVYANVKSDWGAAEAADDHRVLEALRRVELLLLRTENEVRHGRCPCQEAARSGRGKEEPAAPPADQWPPRHPQAPAE